LTGDASTIETEGKITGIERNQMSTVTYPLSGLHCGACVRRVETELRPLAESVEVSLDPMQVQLNEPKADFAALQAAVARAGNYVLKPNEAPAQQIRARAAIDSVAADARATMANAASAPAESWLATYKPLLLVLVFILVASVLVQVGGFGMGAMAGMDGMDDMPGMGGWAAVNFDDTMRLSMAGFFIAFSFFKLLDIRAFADAYAGYDLLARRWHGWGMIYPFIELALGMAYLANFQPVFTNVVTALVMGFSAIGVIRAVLNKSEIRCACLGTIFKLPMSTVTIVEDVGMGLMAVWMLAMLL
jgi:copper chaperone CopZ